MESESPPPPPKLISPFEFAVQRDKILKEDHDHPSPLEKLPHPTFRRSHNNHAAAAHPPPAAYESPDHPLLVKARQQTKQQYDSSPLLQDEYILPRFEVNELRLGKVLGEGGFGTVLEVLRFDLNVNEKQNPEMEEAQVVRQVKSLDALGEFEPRSKSVCIPELRACASDEETKPKRKRALSLRLGTTSDLFRRSRKGGLRLSQLKINQHTVSNVDHIDKENQENQASTSTKVPKSNVVDDDDDQMQPLQPETHRPSLNFSFVSWRDSMPGHEGQDAIDESDLRALSYEFVNANAVHTPKVNGDSVQLRDNDESHDKAQADESIPSIPNSTNGTTTNDLSPTSSQRRIVLFSNNEHVNTSFDLETSSRPAILQDKYFLSQHATTSTGKSRYAIKIISPSIVNTDFTKFLQAAMDMATETYFLSVLTHPHILKLRAVGQGDMFSPSYFLVLDRLRHKIQSLFEERVNVAKDLAGALGYLHEMCIIYRDLKPENVGFDSFGVAKLFDFGLAKQVRREDANDGTWRLTANTGSLRYMAPEVGNGWPYNFKADSYSFTILLWEILILELPFKHYTPLEIVNMVRKWGERPKLKQEWSERLKECLSNGWDNNYRKRPTMQDFETILNLELHESMPV
eukprot:scaffold86042_cov80-Cyclotella_meneghiniana.AAC.2